MEWHVRDFSPNPEMAKAGYVLMDTDGFDRWGFAPLDPDWRIFWLFDMSTPPELRGAAHDAYVQGSHGLHLLANIWRGILGVDRWPLTEVAGLPAVWDDSRPFDNNYVTPAAKFLSKEGLVVGGYVESEVHITGWEILAGSSVIHVTSRISWHWVDGKNDVDAEEFWADPALPVIGSFGRTSPGIRQYRQNATHQPSPIKIAFAGWHRPGSPTTSPRAA